MSGAPAPLRFAVIGDGPWGTALAARLAHNGVRVRLVGRRPPRLPVPDGVVHSTDLGAALAGHEALVLAVGVAGLGALLANAAPHLEGHHRVVTTARGLLPGAADGDAGPLRASEAVQSATCVRQLAVLAGAADAPALAAGHPAALVIGSAFPSWARELQTALAGPTLRVYTNRDRAGVELANTLASVLTVALGAARGLQVGAASEATALTRALAEMERLVVALGGQPGTAYGLAGLGVLADAVFQADGEAFAVGAALARGDRGPAERAGELGRAAQILARRAAAGGARAPMVDAIAALFTGALSPRDALSALMSRAARAE